jgi:hypothetical protein
MAATKAENKIKLIKNILKYLIQKFTLRTLYIIEDGKLFSNLIFDIFIQNEKLTSIGDYIFIN